jgi:hypothetical protein
MKTATLASLFCVVFIPWSVVAVENKKWEADVIASEVGMTSRDEKVRVDSVNTYMISEDELRGLYLRHADLAIEYQRAMKKQMIGMMKLGDPDPKRVKKIKSVTFEECKTNPAGYGKEYTFVKEGSLVFIAKAIYEDDTTASLGAYVVIGNSMRRWIGFGYVQTRPEANE